MITLRHAVDIAFDAHEGQVDKAGQPYILHSLAVGAMGRTHDEQIVGILHDVLEDSDISYTRLVAHGIGSEIGDALLLLTPRFGEFYETYIQKIKQNPLARAVKINDLYHNLGRLGNLPEADRFRLYEKYNAALVVLEF